MRFENVSDETVLDCAVRGTFRVRSEARKEIERRGLEAEDVPTTELDFGEEDEICGSTIPWGRMSQETTIRTESIMELYGSGDPTFVEEAKEQIVYRFGKWVAHVIRTQFSQFAATHGSDMFDCGVIGLMKAMKGYDGKHAFTTYSRNFIVHELAAYVGFATGSSSPHYAKLRRDFGRARTALEADGRPVTAAAIAEISGMSESAAKREMEADGRFPVPSSLDSDERLPEPSDDGMASVEETIDVKLTVEAILKDMERLDVETRTVILRHVVREETYETIGREMGIDPKEAKAAYRKGIRKLRRANRERVEFVGKDDRKTY